MKDAMSDLMKEIKIRGMDSRFMGTSRDVLKIVESTEDRVARLSLTCKAMWSLLKEYSGLTDESLTERISQMRQLEGNVREVRDGKFTEPAPKCPKCEAAISREFGRCLFCGHEDPSLKTASFDAW